jgi:hypothetical protein
MNEIGTNRMKYFILELTDRGNEGKMIQEDGK